MFDNVVEQFPSRRILHDEVELLLGLDDLVELYNLRMLDNLEDMYLSRDPFDIGYIYYFTLFKDLNCHFSFCQDVHANLDFAECTLTNCSA